MIKGRYEQEPFDDKDVLCELDGDDDDEDLQHKEDLPNKYMENSIISYKSFGDIIEDY